MALQVPTSPNICYCSTWGNQNKRNMHLNEQQMPTNWRLDRVKIWSRQSELMKCIVYLLTAVLPAIKRVAASRWWHNRVSVVQRTRASARKAIELLQRETTDFISPDLWSRTALTSIWSITSSGRSCNSGSIRRRSKMWMNSRSKRLKFVFFWSRTLLRLLSTNGENVCVLVISNIYCRQ